jgi:hypothetical protein
VEVPPPAAHDAPVVPAPVATGGDLDDSGDDTEDGDKTKDDNEEGDDFYYDGPHEGEPFCTMHSSEVAPGYFPWLHWNTLLELGNTLGPSHHLEPTT